MRVDNSQPNVDYLLCCYPCDPLHEGYSRSSPTRTYHDAIADLQSDTLP